MRTLMKIPAGCVRRELCLGEEEGAGASRVGAVGWRWCHVPASHGWGSLHLWQPQQRHFQGCRDAVCVCRDVFVLPPGMVTFPRLPELQERLDNALSTGWDWWGVCSAFDNPGVPFHLWRLLELRIEIWMFWGVFQEEEGQYSMFSTFSPSFIQLRKSRSEGRLDLGLMRSKICSEAPPAMAWWDSLPHGESVPFGGWIEGCVMCAGCLGCSLQGVWGAVCSVLGVPCARCFVVPVLGFWDAPGRAMPVGPVAAGSSILPGTGSPGGVCVQSCAVRGCWDQPGGSPRGWDIPAVPICLMGIQS